MPGIHHVPAVRHRLERGRRAMKRRRHQQISAWFAAFDQNSSGLLEREQLSRLLEHLFGETPTEAGLDFLMKKLACAVDTTGDGILDTRGISRDAMERARHCRL